MQLRLLLILISSLVPRPASLPPTDWPQLYGTDDGVVREEGLKLEWGPAGPPERWRMEIGTGYSQPVIVGGRLILFHRKGDRELVACFDVKSQERLWEFGYPTSYVDRFGYNSGPRCTPIIANDVVYTLGAEGKLHALDFQTGAKKWSRDLFTDYAVEQGFFGVGATPLLEGDRLIINVGGKTTDAGIVAVSIADGKTLWKATSDGASYATPKAATTHGKRHAIVFTEAALVSVDPANGEVRWRIPFRSRLYESANATSPLIVGDVVVASATYGVGAIAVKVLSNGDYQELWRTKWLDSHFSNLLAIDGNLYGIAGRHESGSELFCCDLATGKARWKVETPLGRGQILRVGDKLLGWGERGCLAVVEADPKEFRLRCASDPDPQKGLLKYPTWTPPVIYDGRLYLRNETTLLCLDLRSP